MNVTREQLDAKRKGRPLPRPETEIQSAILAYLRACVPGLWERNNRGVVRTPGKGGRDRLITYGGMEGASDIKGILAPHGRAVAIEVKRPGDNPTVEQQAYLERVRRVGGIAFVARSIDDVRRELGAATR